MNIRMCVAASAAFVAVSAGLARADFVTVDLSSQVNDDARVLTDGFNYPVGGQTLDFAGVPFALSLYDDDAESLGIVATNSDGTGADVHSFTLNIHGAARLYTLINSKFGIEPNFNGKVEVFGTNGAYAAFDLVQGVNIRDHFNGFFNNNVSDPTVVPTYFGVDSTVRLDRQVLELGAGFANEDVTELRFTGGPVDFAGAGQPFMAGATFQLVPTPGAAALGTLGLLAGLRRRR